MAPTKKTASHKASPKVFAQRKPMVGLRASKDELQILSEAASLSRRSRQEFVLFHSLSAANKILGRAAIRLAD